MIRVDRVVPCGAVFVVPAVGVADEAVFAVLDMGEGIGRAGAERGKGDLSVQQIGRIPLGGNAE